MSPAPVRHVPTIANDLISQAAAVGFLFLRGLLQVAIVVPRPVVMTSTLVESAPLQAADAESLSMGTE